MTCPIGKPIGAGRPELTKRRKVTSESSRLCGWGLLRTERTAAEASHGAARGRKDAIERRSLLYLGLGQRAELRKPQVWDKMMQCLSEPESQRTVTKGCQDFSQVESHYTVGGLIDL
eukprot:3987697-Amphidinium_carterae.2